jgi:peptidylprolyl isomerase
MTKVKTGDTVKIELSGETKDGHTFLTADKPETVEFTVGQGEVIKAVDEAVVGMEPGEIRKVEVSPEEGFGPYNKDMVAELDRKSIPPGQKVEEGQHLELHRADGQKIPAVVLSVTPEAIMIDANHPLAGRDLRLDIKLVKVV